MRNKGRAGSSGRGSGRHCPRELAVITLARWEKKPRERRQPLDEFCEEVIRENILDDGRDRALFRILVFGVVRHLLLLDFLADRFLSKPGKISGRLRNIIRTAVLQICFLDRIPVSAAVNESVKITRRLGYAWAAGMVNAVLRKVASEHERQGLLPLSPGRFPDTVKHIAVQTSHPEWMVKRWNDRSGNQNTLLLCSENNRLPHFTVRVNTVFWSREEARERLVQNGFHVRNCRFSPDGLVIENFHASPTNLPGFDRGGFMVQDESSQLASILLAPGKNMKILDFCAGSGGKTTHIAALAGDMADVVATDRNPYRLSLLEQNRKRLGLESIKILPFDSLKNSGAWEGCFDRILLDAPCSGLGVIRRRPDIKWNRKETDIERLAGLQMDLLERAARMCKAGGIMVYSVCTLEPEETAEVIHNFLAGRKRWRHVSASGLLPPGAGELVRDGFLFIHPAERGPDGFFAAVLECTG